MGEAWRAVGAVVLAALLRGGVAVAAKPGAPANDTCAAPTPINTLPFSIAGTTVGAADDLSTLPPGCSDLTQVAGPDVIYALDVGVGNNLTFSVAPTAGYDTAIYLLGTCGDSTTCQKGTDPGSVGATETFSVNNLVPGRMPSTSTRSTPPGPRFTRPRTRGSSP